MSEGVREGGRERELGRERGREGEREREGGSQEGREREGVNEGGREGGRQMKGGRGRDLSLRDWALGKVSQGLESDRRPLDLLPR